MRAAGTAALVIAAIAAIAAILVLGLRSVELADRVAALEDQAAVLAERVAPAGIVVTKGGGLWPRVVEDADGEWLEVCVIYDSPAGNRIRDCRWVRAEGRDPDDRPLWPEHQRLFFCYLDSVRIGDPLPDCWR